MNPINVSLHDIEAILAVARHGSFRAAAQDLGLSQPSVSSRVRHAEDVLGVKLFHRTTRSVRLTAHGQRLVHRAEQAMSELRALTQEFKDEARMQRGRVVIGATPAISGTLLPTILHRFRQRWPGIEVVLRDDFLGRALDRVHEGEVDFAVTPTAEHDDRFVCETITREEFVIVAPKGHALVASRTASLAEVAQYPLLTLASGTATHELLRTTYAKENLPFEPAYVSFNSISVIAMVRAGFGFAFVPAGLLGLFDMQALGTSRLAPEGLFRESGITRAKGRALQPAAEALIDAIRLGFSER